MVRMPFGKYKGQLIDDLPLDYIEWCLDNLDLRPELEDAFERRLEGKSSYSSPPPPPPNSGFLPKLDSKDIPLLIELMEAGRRSMAKSHHPDHGGDTATMQRINRIVDQVKSLKGVPR